MRRFINFLKVLIIYSFNVTNVWATMFRRYIHMVIIFSLRVSNMTEITHL